MPKMNFARAGAQRADLEDFGHETHPQSSEHIQGVHINAFF